MMIDAGENIAETLYFGLGIFLYIIWFNPHANPEKGKFVYSPG